MDSNNTVSISIFKSATDPKPFDAILYQSALERISNGFYQKEVEAIRGETDKKKRNVLKKKLPCVTWSGDFVYRNTTPENLKQYSGIICHDVDELAPGQVAHLKTELSKDPNVYAVFVSPSGNGLKVLFKVDADESTHLTYWQSIGRYLNSVYSIVPDESCKDITRLCFLSYDTTIHINEQCRLVGEEFLLSTLTFSTEPAAQPKPTTAQEQKPIPTETDLEQKFLKICHDTASKKYFPAQGNYNAYINLFSLFALRYDIDETTTAHAVAQYCGWPSPDKEDIAVIRSAYQKFAGERGIWKEDYLSKNTTTAATVKTNKAASKAAPKEATYNDEVKFWYKTTKTDKDGKPVVDSTTGEIKEEYRLSYDAGITFLHNNGFCLFPAGDGYRFIRVDENKSQVELTNEIKIEKFFLDYLNSDDSDEFKKVREIFRRSVSKYCNERQLRGMKYYTPQLRKDTPDAAYVYFNNCYFEITKDEARRYDYHKTDGFIWKKQVIEHEFSNLEWMGCDFHQFLIRAITAKQVNDESELDESDRKKYLAAVTGIGYMLHKYKNPTLTKTIIGVDKKTRSNNDETNGGSGKSLYSKAVGKMMNMLILDGPNFKFEDQFAFQRVGPDTELINFNDVLGNFNFNRLFGMITEEFTYNPKYQPSVTVPFSESPKFYISTNHTLRGDGESVRRRQHIIEFSDYFNADHTPAKEFGRMFFYGWDDQEWSRFYGYFMHCIKTYLDIGLVDFPLENYALRKLLEWNQGAGVELNDYLNETVKDQLIHKPIFDKKKLFEGFLGTTSVDVKYIKLNSFSGQLKIWANINNLEINAHKNGERDRRNGIDYLTFTYAKKEDNDRDIFTEVVEGYESGLI